MTNLTKELSRLSVERRAVLELLLKRSRSHNEKSPSIPRRKSDGVIPLSFGQQRMWFLDQLEPGNPFYNGSAAMRLTGRLDTAALERALGEIVRRHEALRTVFAMVEGQPRQIVMPSTTLSLEVVDLRHSPQAEQELEARQHAFEEAQRPFDLTLGPLFRIALLRLGEETHILLLTTHHIIFDGWSAEALIKEMAALYNAYVNGRESPLDELPIQYADYACWQREWLTREVLEEQVAYWREQLAGAPPILELPADRPRLAIPSFRGGQEIFTVPRRIAEGLRALSRREGATLFMTLLAAWQVFLSRYSRQTDICIGVPIADRTRAEVEGLIGFFVNTLVIRTKLSDSQTFTEALRRVKETCLSAYAHQDLPFERLVEELRPERSQTHSPLFQVMFGFHNNAPEAPALAGLKIDLERTYNRTARFDLYFSIEDGEELKGAIEYSADLYDASTIRNMTGHIQTLLAAIVDAPEKKITELQLLTEAERRRILIDWNDTAVEYPSQKCVHELFEEQVMRRPESVAVVCEGEQVTYCELNRRSNQMAHYLRELGVGPEVLVGLLMERSIEMVIALLGALKSGGAYVPLDPLYPVERLAFMLNDAWIGVLLAQGATSEVLPPGYARVINIDAGRQEIEQRSQTNPGRSAGSQNLAYVIYTSGSTGRPKGVQIQHGAVVNFLTSMQRQPGIAEHDALPAVTTLSFDIAVLELMMPLTIGARVVLVNRETATDGTQLSRRMVEAGASLMQATPATWRLLLQARWEAESQLKVLCGGEAWGRDLAAQLLRDGASVWNMYGPTETTIWSTIAKVEQGEGPPPIGRPIANTQIYVLDAELNPVPIGAPGELYVGGDGLARGYLNRPDLTAERFIPHSFSSEPGGRLYRTGDLARQLSDGSLEYLGRVDHQIKIRGFRIELGEIEAVLVGHPAVGQAVVTAEADASGERRLVAYLVAAEGEERCPAGEMRTHLRQHLPDYMRPSLMVWLDQLPLTPNGKIDRRGLPEPGQEKAEMREGYVAARTPLEELLAEIWCEVLGLEEVGMEENFFEVGGHSLLATQVISRVRAACGVEVSLRRLFEAPRVRALAGEVERELRVREGGVGGVGVEGPKRVTVEGEELELSFAQQRLWFLDQLEPDSSAYNIGSAVRLRGELDIGALERAINEIVRRHEVLRTVFIEVGGEPRQVVKAAVGMRLEVEDLSRMEEEEREKEVRERAMEEGERRLDLGRGPLVRVKLLRLGEEEHVLLMTMHHIVSDGWSAGVLVREMGALYEAYRKGEETPLEELGIQYGDYAVWQRERMRGEELERQLRYWLERMRGAPAALELPTDRPRPSVQSFRGAHETFTLAGETVKGLSALCRREGVTLFMTLLAAFQALLYRYKEQPDIVVGTDIANRNNTEVEKLIGFFVNQIVLRTDLRGDPTFIELLRRVREVCLGAYAHQDVPFEKLVDALKPERSLNHAPLIQAKLVLFNAPMIELKVGDLALSPIEIDYNHAQLDLIFNLVETGRGLRGRVEYSIDLFDAATIRRLWQEFEMILKAVTVDALLRLSDLKNALVEEGERQLNAEGSKLEGRSRLKLKGVSRRGISMPM
jgi:amino acid adenylation domain-containing protein